MFLSKNKLVFSSESVGPGHPDKICDKISDAILDAYLEKDKKSRVACEVFANNRLIIIGGEVNSTIKIDHVEIAWEVILDLGYSKNDFTIMSNMNIQSSNIAQTIEKKDKKIGAGDQGIVFGYATNETKEFMPISIVLAHKVLSNIENKIRNKKVNFLGFDMKSQVSVSYNENNKIKIETFLISIQHIENCNISELKKFIENEMINVAIEYNLNTDFEKIINPSGIFVIGGPIGDTGLTGRKIIVDTYGGASKHGGGAFSGKDPTKIDRSGAYFCRYIAKNIVASGLAQKCEIQLGFAIGITHPISIHINTFGTSKYSNNELLEAINSIFNFDIKSFIEELNLYNVEYKQTAVYGHFGRNLNNFTWEKLNKVDLLKKYFAKNN